MRLMGSVNIINSLEICHVWMIQSTTIARKISRFVRFLLNFFNGLRLIKIQFSKI